MKLLRPLFFCALSTSLHAQLPSNYQLQHDWLVDKSGFSTQVITDEVARTLTLSNGLIQRTIDVRLGTTVGYLNQMTGESIIRAVEPEGFVTIDGVIYPIGGAQGQPNKAFLTKEWLKTMTPLNGSLKFTGFKIGNPQERLKWKRSRHHASDAVWPPKGAYLRLDYSMPQPSVEKLLSESLVDSSYGRKTSLV